MQAPVHMEMSLNLVGRVEPAEQNEKNVKDSYCHAQQWPSKISVPGGKVLFGFLPLNTDIFINMFC